MGDAPNPPDGIPQRASSIAPAQRCWGGGLWGARSLFTMGPRNRCRKRLSRVELLPEPGSESRFRIPPEPGAAAWWERSPGSLTIRVVHSFCVLDPGISAPEFQPRNFTPGRAGALIPVA